jgi:hypothetical protein
MCDPEGSLDAACTVDAALAVFNLSGHPAVVSPN